MSIFIHTILKNCMCECEQHYILCMSCIYVVITASGLMFTETLDLHIHHGAIIIIVLQFVRIIIPASMSLTTVKQKLKVKNH